MKAERRHELKQNSLVRGIENLPKSGKDSGSRILLGVVLAAFVVLAVRYYFNTREQKKAQLAEQLSSARLALASMQSPRLLGSPVEESAPARNRLLKQVDNVVSDILSTPGDAMHTAQAKNVRADAFLRAATLGNPPEATTRPDLMLPRPPEKLLEDAATAYQEVLQLKEGVPRSEIADAHFGLGAIAENKAQWDDARRQYQAVAGDADMPRTFKDYANLRLSLLDKISAPILVGVPVTRPTDLEPSTAPTGPATLPASGPVAPSTSPTTMPATPAIHGPTTAK